MRAVALVHGKLRPCTCSAVAVLCTLRYAACAVQQQLEKAAAGCDPAALQQAARTGLESLGQILGKLPPEGWVGEQVGNKQNCQMLALKPGGRGAIVNNLIMPCWFTSTSWPIRVISSCLMLRLAQQLLFLLSQQWQQHWGMSASPASRRLSVDLVRSCLWPLHSPHDCSCQYA